MNIESFNESNRFESRINNYSRVITLNGATRERLDDYITYFHNDGFVTAEYRETDRMVFTALKKDTFGIYLNYYFSTKILTVATQEGDNYFDFHDESGVATVAPQITQIALSHFGMSYVIRLSDGRFIVIDGGREFDDDVTKLYECLKRDSITTKPVIAAWIFTHPHPDHIFCFMRFLEIYSKDVTIEKCIYNFPEEEDTDRYSKLLVDDKRYGYDMPSYVNIKIFHEKIREHGIPVYPSHTGQRYIIGDAHMEILASVDDTIHLSSDINAASLIIRMQLGGQTILWTADAYFCITSLCSKYGTYLKADILQIPHHGCHSGLLEAEIEAYRLINPSVCLYPERDVVYIWKNQTREGTRFLLSDAGIDEIITGSNERTITLPYSAPPEAKEEVNRKYMLGFGSNA